MPTQRLTLLACAALLSACAGGEDDPSASSFDPSAVSTDSEDTGDAPACVPGAQSTCACPGGGDGVQQCNADGSGLGACDCGEVSDSADATNPGTGADDTGSPDPCGDSVCAEDESCDLCPQDCGECVPCTSAPSCEGALIPPLIDTHADGLDNFQMLYVAPDEALSIIVAQLDAGSPGMRALVAALDVPRDDEHPFVGAVRAALAADAGTTAALRRQLAIAGLGSPRSYRDAHPEPRSAPGTIAAAPQRQAGGVEQPCENPRLRIRVAQIDVFEEYDDVTNDIIYCLIAAEGGEASELRLTPLTPSLDEGTSYAFPLASGVVWGQQDLVAPKGNLALTYNCIESDDLSVYNGLIEAIGNAADAAGGLEGDSGWIFDTVGIIADLLPAVLSLDGDDHLFNGAQIIPADMHLALTQGAFWNVRRSYESGFLGSDWDWQLRMEVWGCHDNGQ